jgi:hypothetical protein
VAAFPACRLVDEDVSDCGEDFNLDYELQLVTNLRTEIQTVLDLEADLQVATELQSHLSEVFTDLAHDVDLSFYDTEEPMARLEHFGVVMDASESSYSLFLPGRPYLHTCVANLEAEPSVTLEDGDQCHTARLVQHPEVKDTVSIHKAGIFTARKRMDVLTGVDQHFDVSLFMVNAATALILDLADAPDVKDLKVFLSGFADGFNVADSSYTFSTKQVVRTEMLPAEPGSTERCFTSIHFPSRDVEPATKVVIDIDDPDQDKRSDEILWQWEVYVTLADGTVTKTILGSYNPLHPAQLKAVKGTVHANGGVVSNDHSVGANVTLDWHEGMAIPIEF